MTKQSYGCRMATRMSIVSHFPVITWLAGAVAHCCCPAAGESTILYITSPGKNHNAKLQVWLLMNAYALML